MSIILQKTRRLLDLIYPASCHLCHRSLTDGKYLCDSCRDSLHFIESPFCSCCGEPFDGDISDDFTCPNCYGIQFDFEFARAALRSEGSSRTLVHDYKYRRQIHLSCELGKLLRIALDDQRFTPYLEDGLLVPVPLYWLRLKKRKFNQSEEIAISLSKQIGIPVVKVLTRNRNTQTQTRFSRSKRLENLHEAFNIRSRYQQYIKGRSVILIDDVLTTGSTANECAKVLMEHGAFRVAVLTLLRG